MPVTVEVPEGHKFCKHCGGVKPLSDFPTFNRKISTGEVMAYKPSRCKACAAAAVRASNWRKKGKEGDPPPMGLKPFKTYWPRCADEAACDAALMGWPVAHHATVVAFQGPRL
jgi:hypothetical protein